MNRDKEIEKQAIEEMTKEMCNLCREAVTNAACEETCCVGVCQHAEAIYNAGYRKQSENTVEVVRCKDCREWQRNVGFVDSPNGHCFCHDIDTNGHDFCSYGEMKGGAE